ncbi:M phase phosphoprotein 10 [Typha angustifolia]|uniref:M phase phosphoprotein 10 n=1 Tax=Typha angustifolia TaxID=59011 RepID=UPI003C2EB105
MAATTGGEEALERLCSTNPATYLSPSPELSGLARVASRHLFSSLAPLCPNPPLESLLVDESFDAEQIWYQIDLLYRPLLSHLRRELRRLEKRPPSRFPLPPPIPEKKEEEEGEEDKEDEEEEEDEGDGEENEGDDEDMEEEEEDEDDDGDEEEEEEQGGRKAGGVEDGFLKINELEEYLEKDEAKEYGLAKNKKGNQDLKKKSRKDEDEDDDEEEEDGGDDLNLEDFDDVDEGDEEVDVDENARYEDFFGGKAKKGNKKDGKKRNSSKKVQFLDSSGDMEMDDDQEDNEDNMKILSTHEKEIQKMRSKIDEMEKANLEPKSWTMQGEITAAKRPKNSALEVDLDFEHNVRPAPVITEEVTASLEDLIRKRIVEGHFDDVERAPALPSKAPKEHKELDENKSKKGLAEIYEEEYAQKAGLAAAPLSVSDEQKREASILFKKICLKLDALSHFHFAPKPVIEDMSIQANVPALAMEEVAPVAVSDAAMLAPEEVFEGKGDIKEEGELTQAERRRRRANKKRKFKAETAKREAKKPRESGDLNHPNGK